MNKIIVIIVPRTQLPILAGKNKIWRNSTIAAVLPVAKKTHLGYLEWENITINLLL